MPYSVKPLCFAVLIRDVVSLQLVLESRSHGLVLQFPHPTHLGDILGHRRARSCLRCVSRRRYAVRLPAIGTPRHCPSRRRWFAPQSQSLVLSALLRLAPRGFRLRELDRRDHVANSCLRRVQAAGRYKRHWRGWARNQTLFQRADPQLVLRRRHGTAAGTRGLFSWCFSFNGLSLCPFPTPSPSYG